MQSLFPVGIREKEGIRLVVPDSELQQRMHYWDDKQKLLKPYSDCSIFSVCGKCDFTLRDDAKYYVDQLFMKDKGQIKDKNALFPKVINMGKRLSELNTGYEGDRFRQLLYCVCIRYIRKAALEIPAIRTFASSQTLANANLSTKINARHVLIGSVLPDASLCRFFRLGPGSVLLRFDCAFRNRPGSAQPLRAWNSSVQSVLIHPAHRDIPALCSFLCRTITFYNNTSHHGLPTTGDSAVSCL